MASSWILWLALLTALLGAAALAVAAVGQRRWAASLQPLEERLESERLPPAPTHYDARELQGLPAPVQRYFHAVLKDGQALITAATIHMEGRFNLSATGEQWRNFSSRQRVSTRRPGFLWDARIAQLPGMDVHVVDSYVAGQGLLRASVLGLFQVADQQGDGEIARGEFMRWFAEAVWVPTALLPSQGVRWEAVDDRAAKATLADGPLALTLLFRFDDAGRIASFRAEARGALVNGVMVQAPWEGRFSNYQWHGGIAVPFAGEVAWMRLEGRRTYFKGSVTQLAFEFAS